MLLPELIDDFGHSDDAPLLSQCSWGMAHGGLARYSQCWSGVEASWGEGTEQFTHRDAVKRQQTVEVCVWLVDKRGRGALDGGSFPLISINPLVNQEALHHLRT